MDDEEEEDCDDADSSDDDEAEEEEDEEDEEEEVKEKQRNQKTERVYERRDLQPSAHRKDKERKDGGKSAMRGKFRVEGTRKKGSPLLMNRYGKRSNKEILRRAQEYMERTMALQPRSAKSVSALRQRESPTSSKRQKHAVVSPSDNGSPSLKRRVRTSSSGKSKGEKTKKKARREEGY